MDWPGRLCRTRPRRFMLVNVIGPWSGLARAAGPPRPAAAAASYAAAYTASATPAASATSAASAASATPGHLYAALGRCRVFLVEEIERRQADVGDFLLAKRDFVTG